MNKIEVEKQGNEIEKKLLESLTKIERNKIQKTEKTKTKAETQYKM